jgi:hypothetical protein
MGERSNRLRIQGAKNQAMAARGATYESRVTPATVSAGTSPIRSNLSGCVNHASFVSQGIRSESRRIAGPTMHPVITSGSRHRDASGRVGTGGSLRRFFSLEEVTFLRKIPHPGSLGGQSEELVTSSKEAGGGTGLGSPSIPIRTNAGARTTMTFDFSRMVAHRPCT